MLLDKKGLTGVMIGALIFVLILAGGIFGYFFFFGPPVEEAECALSLQWHILTIDDKEDFCYDRNKGEIRFTVENGITAPLQGIYLKIKGKNGQNIFLEEAVLEKAAVFVGKVPFSITGEHPITVQLLPVVDLEGTMTACLDEILERQPLEVCS